MGVCAESKIAPGDGLRSEASDEISDGEGTELAESANAPEDEGFSMIGGEIENADRELGEGSGLLAIGNDGDAARGSGL